MKEPANQRGMFELADSQYRPDTDREGQQRSGSQRTNQLFATRQSLAREPSQDKKVRKYDVFERVYESGRLYGAWQQVRGNAFVAGIDQTTVEMFKWRQDELLMLVHEKPKAGTYRFLKYSLYTPPCTPFWRLCRGKYVFTDMSLPLEDV